MAGLGQHHICSNWLESNRKAVAIAWVLPWDSFPGGGPGCGGVFLRDIVHRGDTLLMEGVYSRALLEVGT